MRFMPGEMLYQVTDLSSVWVIADLSEQDIGLVKTGARARVTTTAYPNEAFDGRITFIYPTMTAETRSVPVRVELANPGQKIKPAMFAQVEVTVGGKAPVLTVPDSAVIDTGARRIVLVQVQEGRFEPRDVELGARGENFVEVVKGVSDGEQVVVAANFLIDAESNLKAAIGGMGAAPAAPAASTSPAPATVGHKAEGSVDSIDLQAGTREPQPRPGRQPEVAGDDDGVQGRQRRPAGGPEAGTGGELRIRRAPARRVRGDLDHRGARRRGAGARKPAAAAPAAAPGTHSGH